jgi:hypothetical protein
VASERAGARLVFATGESGRDKRCRRLGAEQAEWTRRGRARGGAHARTGEAEGAASQSGERVRARLCVLASEGPRSPASACHCECTRARMRTHEKATVAGSGQKGRY